VSLRRGSITTSFGDRGPARRSSTRIHITVSVAATLCPTSRRQSVTSMSAKVPGWPSQPKVSLSAAAAVAVQSRVLPSM